MDASMIDAYDRFEQLLNERKMKPADVSRISGVSSTVLSEWKTHKSAPKTDKLVAIANAVSTTVEYLATGEQSDLRLLTAEEERLLCYWNRLESPMRDMLMIEMSALADHSETKHAQDNPKRAGTSGK